MIIVKDKLKIAVAQASPVMFDKVKCKEKAVRLIHECAAKRAEMLL